MTTLRDRLTRPLPAADSDEMRRLLCDAASYTATQLAGSYEHISDSTIDSHAAMIAALTLINNTIYSYDQTMNSEDALTLMLDEPDGAWLFSETLTPNTSGLSGTAPSLFDYFNLDDEDEEI